MEILTFEEVDLEILRGQLKAMSDAQLRACGRGALERCGPELWKHEPQTPEQILLVETRDEWRRRSKQPKHYNVSKGLDCLDGDV